ncbi:MAG: radical SAM protein [Candidatus Moraniibacteriota bacterium]
MKRYVLRIENSILEPTNDPIRSILLDRVGGRYNLLNARQTEEVKSAINLKTNQKIETSQPFRVYIELADIFQNVETIKTSSDRSDILSAPISAYMEISKKCNLNCIGCYQGKRESVATITTGQAKKFLDDFAKIGGIIVRLTGKEPTAHPEIVEIIKHAKSLGLKVALNTNGVTSDEKIEQIIKSGATEVVVSLDGNRTTHNHFRNANIFDRTMKSAQMYAKSGVDTRFNTTISPENMKDIRFVAQLADSMGIYVSYIPIRNIGAAIEDSFLTAKDMEKISREIVSLRKEVGVRLLTYFDIFGEESDYYHPMFQLTPCHARKNIFIKNTGNVYPCDHLAALGDVFCGGNILQEDLIEIWQNGKGLETYRTVEMSNDCQKCHHFRKNCYGGCISEYMFKTGGRARKLKKDRLCPC